MWAPIRFSAKMVLTAFTQRFLMTYRLSLTLEIGFSNEDSSHRCSRSSSARGLLLIKNFRNISTINKTFYKLKSKAARIEAEINTRSQEKEGKNKTPRKRSSFTSILNNNNK